MLMPTKKQLEKELAETVRETDDLKRIQRNLQLLMERTIREFNQIIRRKV